MPPGVLRAASTFGRRSSAPVFAPRVSDDYREVDVALKLGLLNRNDDASWPRWRRRFAHPAASSGPDGNPARGRCNPTPRGESMIAR
jgi:hypothetical protein